MATRKEVIAKAMELKDVFSAEEIEVLGKLYKACDRKSTGKPSKEVLANIGVKNDILAYLADGVPRTAREIAEALGVSVNKVASLLTACVKDGKVAKLAKEKSKDAPKYEAIEGAEPYEKPQAEAE